jgi:hypothetical protein
MTGPVLGEFSVNALNNASPSSVQIDRSHCVKVDSGTPLSRFTDLLEEFPDCLNLRWRVIRNIGTFPSEDFHEVGTAFFVAATKDDVGMVQDEAQTCIQRPGFRAQFGIFCFVPEFDVRNAVDGFGFGSGKLGG